MATSNEIGNRIRQLRESILIDEKQMTQAQLAKDLYVKRETVNQWENGTRDLKTEYTIEIADYFNVTCDYILRGIKSENVEINKQVGLSDLSIKCLSSLTPAKKHCEDTTIDTINLLLENECYWLVDANNDFVCKDTSSGINIFEAIDRYLKAQINKDRTYAITPSGNIVSDLDPITNEICVFHGDDILIKSEMIDGALLLEIQQKLIELKKRGCSNA